MYKLIIGRPKKYIILYTGSLHECIKARKVSGDLILNPQGKICQGFAWLFPWEKNNSNCYARRSQKCWTH